MAGSSIGKTVVSYAAKIGSIPIPANFVVQLEFIMSLICYFFSVMIRWHVW